MINEPFLINPVKTGQGKPGKKKKVLKNCGSKKNPGEILIVGGNPMTEKKARKRRRKSTTANTGETRRKYRRRNPAANPVKKAKRRYRRKTNAPLAATGRSRRRYRRNPAGMSLGMPSLKNPISLVAPVAVGLGGAIVTDQVPIMLGLSGYMAKAAQAGAIVGGGMVVNSLFGPIGMTAWIIGGGIVLLKDMVGTLLFPDAGVVTTVQGLGNIPGYPISGYSGIDDISPRMEYGGFGAFPSETPAMRGELGAYPNQIY